MSDSGESPELSQISDHFWGSRDHRRWRANTVGGMDGTAPHEALEPLARQARDQYQRGHDAHARATLTRLIAEVTDAEVTQVVINRDVYSLNSLNGTAAFADGRRFFFKFHAEEGEDETIQEYYNAELLDEAGYPVDVPVFACGEPGRQILLYQLRNDLRLSDLCRAGEAGGTYPEPITLDDVVGAQRELDTISAERMIATMHEANLEELAAEPVHRLFRDRLVDLDGTHRPGEGGRVARFYRDKEHKLGELTLSWEQLRNARWVINGVEYSDTIGEIFSDAALLLTPGRLGRAAVVAHGDAHNANVWFERQCGTMGHLVLFDPAFAGRHLPALLAEVKPTFHNIFAHPFWLYEPGIASERYTADVEWHDGVIEVRHDYALSSLREQFLVSKAELNWRPLLSEMAARNTLPSDWERIVRRALFCCPTLVHELRAGGPTGHSATSAAIGWSVAVAAGSAPTVGHDVFTAFFADVTPDAESR